MKRKRNQEEEANTLDPLFGQHKALPISQSVLESIKPETVPTNAETYLALVRKEAESSSSVMFIKTVDYDEVKNDHEIEEPNNAEWEAKLNQIVNDFNRKKAEFPEIGSLRIPESFELPSNYTQWYKFLTTNEPTNELISNFDQELSIKLIIYLTKLITKDTKPIISAWITSLLVRLPLLLETKDVAIIRSLGKRANLIYQKDQSDICLFITTIVSRLYGQKDLELFN